MVLEKPGGVEERCGPRGARTRGSPGGKEGGGHLRVGGAGTEDIVSHYDLPS